MSRRRKQSYNGCSIESRGGKLRLRYRALPTAAGQGAARQPSRGTGLADTPENRAALRPLAEAVGKLLAAGKDPAPALDSAIVLPRGPQRKDARTATPASPATDARPLGPTVADYYATWLAERRPHVRTGQARDYRRHFDGYILPTLGDVSLAELRAKDVRALQAELLARNNVRTGKPLSVKTVKNVIGGSLRAMLRQAAADELVTRDVFAGLTWPEWREPEPAPFTIEEVRRVCEWFARKRFGFPPLRGSMGVRRLLHLPFHGYVHTLFWTGLRPSEASGLQWGDIDLARDVLYMRRSYHLYGYNAPKTKNARRTVELLPETVRILLDLRPLHVTPDTPVFVNTGGGPIEPKSFSVHWDDCLRVLGIRPRGLYCTKDTYVSHALQKVGDPLWVEKQTGVAYTTLRRHYARWMPTGERAEVRRLAALTDAAPDAADKGGESSELCPTDDVAGAQSSQLTDPAEDFECEEGDLNPHGCYPTSPSN